MVKNDEMEVIIFPQNFKTHRILFYHLKSLLNITKYLHEIKPSCSGQECYKNEYLCSLITSHANAKSLFKFRFGHKKRYPLTDFQNVCRTYATNRDLDTDRKILLLPSNSKIFLQKIKNLTSDFTH